MKLNLENKSVAAILGTVFLVIVIAGIYQVSLLVYEVAAEREAAYQASKKWLEYVKITDKKISTEVDSGLKSEYNHLTDRWEIRPYRKSTVHHTIYTTQGAFDVEKRLYGIFEVGKFYDIQVIGLDQNNLKILKWRLPRTEDKE